MADKDLNKKILNELLENVEHSIRILKITPDDKFWQGVLFGKLSIVEDILFCVCGNKEYKEFIDRWEVADTFIKRIADR